MIELLAALKRRSRAIEERNLDALLEAHHTVLRMGVLVSTDAMKRALAELERGSVVLEGTYTRRLLAALRTHPTMKDAVIFKHSDRFSRGVPDFSITLKGRTTWWEVKMLPNRPTKIQSYYLRKLAPVGFVIFVRGNCWEVASYGGSAKVFHRVIGDKFNLLLMVITENCMEELRNTSSDVSISDLVRAHEN